MQRHGSGHFHVSINPQTIQSQLYQRKCPTTDIRSLSCLFEWELPINDRDFSIDQFKVVTRSNIDTLAKSANTVVMDAQKDRARPRNTVCQPKRAGSHRSLGFCWPRYPIWSFLVVALTPLQKRRRSTNLQRHVHAHSTAPFDHILDSSYS